MGPFGLSLGLYVENLQVLSSLFGQVWCCMLATYIVLKRHVGASLGLDVGNLQVLWGLLGQVFVLYVGILLVLLCLLDRVWCCMLATYRSYGGLLD